MLVKSVTLVTGLVIANGIGVVPQVGDRRAFFDKQKLRELIVNECGRMRMLRVLVRKERVLEEDVRADRGEGNSAVGKENYEKSREEKNLFSPSGEEQEEEDSFTAGNVNLGPRLRRNGRNTRVKRNKNRVVSVNLCEKLFFSAQRKFFFFSYVFIYFMVFNLSSNDAIITSECSMQE